MKSTVFHAALVLCVACANADIYQDCGSNLAKIDNVQVSGCDGSHPECTLKKNSNVTISLDLIPNVDISKVITVVHGIMMGMPVPFPLAHPNACEGTGLTCPLSANQKYSYSASLPVLKSYPKVRVDVKWELKQDDQDGDIVCLLIPAIIQ